MITLLFAFFLRTFSLSNMNNNLRASNSSSTPTSDSVSRHEFSH
ncbi:hypothetical protein AMTRI_Chr09g16210 [Amborella trichopoda]